jgi:hypothetical protein
MNTDKQSISWFGLFRDACPGLSGLRSPRDRFFHQKQVQNNQKEQL